MGTANITKGARIRARFLQAKPLGSYALAGMQDKVAATMLEVTGVVRHIRVDDPVNPIEVRIYIDYESGAKLPLIRPPGCTCPTAHVELKPAWIQAIL